jgi:hypothetical protein
MMSPSLEVANGKTATIEDTEKTPLQQVVNSPQQLPYNVTEYFNVTNSLSITPHVFADGTIGLETKVVLGSSSKPQGVAQIPIITVDQVQNADNRIRQGESLVIGGIKKTTKRSVVRGVPFLKDLPLIGILFSSKDFEEAATEVLFIITPSISSGGVEQARMARELAKKHEAATYQESWTEAMLDPLGLQAHEEERKRAAEKAEDERANAEHAKASAEKAKAEARRIKMLTEQADIERDKAEQMKNNAAIAASEAQKAHAQSVQATAEAQRAAAEAEKAKDLAAQAKAQQAAQEAQKAAEEAKRAALESERAKAEADKAAQASKEATAKAQVDKARAEADVAKAQAEAAKAQARAEEAKAESQRIAAQAERDKALIEMAKAAARATDGNSNDVNKPAVPASKQGDANSGPKAIPVADANKPRN